jgi:hypothetical protein
MRIGLDGRHRDGDRQINEEHGNTTVGELRKVYGELFWLIAS